MGDARVAGRNLPSATCPVHTCERERRSGGVDGRLTRSYAPPGIRPVRGGAGPGHAGSVNANEFAFLAVGLILGVASGAALVVVLRARPPAPREVRLTISPDAIPRRRGTTLAGDAFALAAVGAARGGPTDYETDDHGGGYPIAASPNGRSVWRNGRRGSVAGRHDRPPAMVGFRVEPGHDPMFRAMAHAASRRGRGPGERAVVGTAVAVLEPEDTTRGRRTVRRPDRIGQRGRAADAGRSRRAVRRGPPGRPTNAASSPSAPGPASASPMRPFAPPSGPTTCTWPRPRRPCPRRIRPWSGAARKAPRRPSATRAIGPGRRRRSRRPRATGWARSIASTPSSARPVASPTASARPPRRSPHRSSDSRSKRTPHGSRPRRPSRPASPPVRRSRTASRPRRPSNEPPAFRRAPVAPEPRARTTRHPRRPVRDRPVRRRSRSRRDPLAAALGAGQAPVIFLLAPRRWRSDGPDGRPARPTIPPSDGAGRRPCPSWSRRSSR